MLFIEIAQLLIRTVAVILGTTLLLRAYMNWIGMPGRNPLAQFVFALTDWMVRPLRRVIPSAGRWDMASLLGAYLVALAMLALMLLLIGVGSSSGAWAQIPLAALGQLLRWVIYMVFFLLIVHVVLSWVNPYAPMAPGIAMLVRPFLAPFQRIIPTVGGFDLSPIALLVLLQIILLVLDRVGL